MILAVAYNLLNAMKQLLLAKEFSKIRMSTLRNVFINICRENSFSFNENEEKTLQRRPIQRVHIKNIKEHQSLSFGLSYLGV